MPHFSPTAIASFIRCPRHWVALATKETRSGTSDAATLGNIVHKALENYAILPLDIEVLYSAAHQELGPLPNDLYQRGLQAVLWAKPFLLNENLVRYADGKPVVEHTFTIPVGDEVFLRGIMDRVEITSDSINVIDFKTGFIFESKEELSLSPQVVIYTLAAKQLAKEIGLPELNVVVSIFALRNQKVINLSLTTEQLVEGGKYVAEAISLMADTLNIVNQAKDYPTKERLNPYCATCGIAATCDTYQKALNEDIVELKELPDDLNKLVDEYYSVNTRLKLCQNYRDKLRNELLEKVDANSKLQVGPFSVSSSVQNTHKVSLPRVLELLNTEQQQTLIKTLPLPVSKLDEFLSKSVTDSALKENLKALVVHEQGATVLGVKRTKP